MGPPPSCPIKLWYIHSAVANTYKEEIESFFPLLRPQSLSCDIRLTACDVQKKEHFCLFVFLIDDRSGYKYLARPTLPLFHKSSRLLKRHTWNWISWSYLCYYMYYILHTASKRKHYHLPALRARNSLWERASAAEKYIKYRTKKSFMLCVQ